MWGSGRTKGENAHWRHWEFLTAVSFGRQSPLLSAISERRQVGGGGDSQAEKREWTKIFRKVQRINLTRGRERMVEGREEEEGRKKKMLSLSV